MGGFLSHGASSTKLMVVLIQIHGLTRLDDLGVPPWIGSLHISIVISMEPKLDVPTIYKAYVRAM